ncbi:MAG: hypothetical protein AAGE01_00070 [Pseudomonadota bacterium]
MLREWCSKGLRGLAAVTLMAALVGCGNVQVSTTPTETTSLAAVEEVFVHVPKLQLVPGQHRYAEARLLADLRSAGIDARPAPVAAGLDDPEVVERLLEGSRGRALLVIVPGAIELADRGDPLFVDTQLGLVNFEDEIAQLHSTGGQLGAAARGDDLLKEVRATLFLGEGAGPAWEGSFAVRNPGSWVDALEVGGPHIASALTRAGVQRGSRTVAQQSTGN